MPGITLLRPATTAHPALPPFSPCVTDSLLGGTLFSPAIALYQRRAAPLNVSPLTARRFMRRALLLDAPVPDIGTALAHHGYVQIDPINV